MHATKHPKTDPHTQEQFTSTFPDQVNTAVATRAPGAHRPVLIIAQDEGCFGRISRPKRRWAPPGVRPHAPAQEKLSHNQQFARRNNTAYPYLLRAMVSCGVCRLGCVGRSSRGGYAYYVCHGKYSGIISRRDEKCPACSIPVEQLDELVWQDVCEMLTHPDMIATAMYRAQGGQWLPQEFQARRENLRHPRG